MPSVNAALTPSDALAILCGPRNPALSAFSDWILLHVVPPVGYVYLRALRRSMRIESRNAEALADARRDPGQYILAFWHSRFPLMPFAYPGRKLVVLSSRHRDSQALARVLHRFGLESAWGSSTRGGAAGLHAVVKRTREGYDVGVTPDGPRGPRRRVQPGVVAIARLTGLPVVPVTFSASPARRLRSWDRTLLPRFFSRGLFVYGEAIRVGREADDAEQERCRAAIEAELDRITDAADLETGIGLEEPRLPVEPT